MRVDAGRALAANIKLGRKICDCTQAEFAKKTKVGLRNLQEYEAGTKSPTVNTLEKIAKAMQMPAFELLR